MSKRDQQYENIIEKLNNFDMVFKIIDKRLKFFDSCLNLLVKRQNDNINNIKDNKKYYIKVLHQNNKYNYLYSYCCNDEKCFAIGDKINGVYNTTIFTFDEIEKLKQDNRLNWLNWNAVTLEEVKDND